LENQLVQIIKKHQHFYKGEKVLRECSVLRAFLGAKNQSFDYDFYT